MAHLGGGGPGFGVFDRLDAIQQDAVGLKSADRSAHGLVGDVIERGDVIPLVAQDGGHYFAHVTIVVDDEDAGGTTLGSCRQLEYLRAQLSVAQRRGAAVLQSGARLVARSDCPEHLPAGRLPAEAPAPEVPEHEQHNEYDHDDPDQVRHSTLPS